MAQGREKRRDDERRPRVVFQQPIDTVEDLVEKWPRLSHVIPSADYLEAGFKLSLADPKFKELRPKPAHAEEALKFYNELVADGRFVRLARKDPAEAAKRLGHEISPEALRDVEQALALAGGASVDADDGVKIAIAVVIGVVIFAASMPDRELIFSSQGELLI